MPTRTEYVRYMRSLEGGYGPARGLRNNDNPFNTWYYGRRVSGNAYAWCSVGECYVENHFGILALNGGKVAYVPNIVAVARKAGARVWHKPSHVPAQGTSWAQPGNKITYDFNRSGEAEHTGTFVARINDREFYASEANTETSQYSDAWALRRRNVADVLDVVELLGVDSPTPTEDVLKTVVDLGASAPQTVKAGERYSLAFELEYADPSKIHTDADKNGRYPSIFPTGGDAPYAVTAEVILAGRPDPGVQLTIAQYHRKDNTFERDIRGEELASARHTLHSNIRMSDQHKYRVDVVNDSQHDVVVERAYLFIAH